MRDDCRRLTSPAPPVASAAAPARMLLDSTARWTNNRSPHVPDALEQIEALAKLAEQELKAVKGSNDLEAFRIKYLGTKGQIKDLMKLLGSVPKEQKPAVGQKVNAVKDEVTAAFEAKKTELASSGAGSK